MKTFTLSTVAIMLIAVTSINADLAFCVLTAVGVIGIAVDDYTPRPFGRGN